MQHHYKKTVINKNTLIKLLKVQIIIMFNAIEHLDELLHELLQFLDVEM